MTGDQLAAALYAEQGYLIMQSPTPKQIGDIIDAVRTNHGAITPPVRITALATSDEWHSQQERAAKLGANIDGFVLPCATYYRVEACD